MSHTLKVIALGFALLAVCLVAARLIGPSQPSYLSRATIVFTGLWLIGAGLNMWLGVTRAGYTVVEELPFFLLVYAIRSAAALWVWWRYSRG